MAGLRLLLSAYHYYIPLQVRLCPPLRCHRLLPLHCRTHSAYPQVSVSDLYLSRPQLPDAPTHTDTASSCLFRDLSQVSCHPL